MRLTSKKVFYFIFEIFLKLVSILTPFVLVFLGAMFINYELFHYFRSVLGIFYIDVDPFKIGLGVIFLILAIASIYFTIRTKSLLYFAIISLILNGIFIFGVILFLLTPAADFLVGRILFNKGFCTVLDQTVKINPTQEAKDIVGQFCSSGSKIFFFDYPTKYSN